MAANFAGDFGSVAAIGRCTCVAGSTPGSRHLVASSAPGHVVHGHTCPAAAPLKLRPNGAVEMRIIEICFRIVLGGGYNYDSTSIRTRYDHSTTYVTTVGLADAPSVNKYLYLLMQLGGCRFESRLGLLRTKVYSALHPSGVGK